MRTKCLRACVRPAGHRKVKITNPIISRPVCLLNGCTDNEATDIVRRVVAFVGITGDILNPPADERFSKLVSEADEEIEVVIEDGCVKRKVREASVNRP